MNTVAIHVIGNRGLSTSVENTHPDCQILRMVSGEIKVDIFIHEGRAEEILRGLSNTLKEFTDKGRVRPAVGPVDDFEEECTRG